MFVKRKYKIGTKQNKNNKKPKLPVLLKSCYMFMDCLNQELISSFPKLFPDN